MKKIFVAVIICLLSVMALAGCSGKDCDGCDEKKAVKSITGKVDGETEKRYLCEDCLDDFHDDMKDTVEMIEEMKE